MYWLLAREVRRLRGTDPRTQPWGEMVDLFLHREPEEAEKNHEEEKAGGEESGAAGESTFAETGAAQEPKDWAAEHEDGYQAAAGDSGATWN